MFFVLSKVLSFFLSPIWWIIFLMLLYFVFPKYKNRKLLLVISFVVMLVFSNQLLFYKISSWWEGELQNSNQIEKFDGIILLGGFSSFQEESQRIRFNGSSDRLLQALDLYKKGKADYLIFTGGSAKISVNEKQEGIYIRDYLELVGIPKDSLLVEHNSRNTHENAMMTFEMLKKYSLENAKFLLVTSGFHMKRALGCFKKVGLNVEPYKTDPLQSVFAPDFSDFLTPSASVLAQWQLLIREWVGYLVYRIKGFV